MARHRKPSPDSPPVVAASAKPSPEDFLPRLEGGGVVLLPVDTVPGLAARADLPRAVAALAALKSRPEDKVFSLVFRDLAHVVQWLEPDAGTRAALARLLPGPLTVVVPGHPRLGRLVPAWAEGVGVRLPGPCPCASLLAALPWPLALTSANASGAATPRRMAEVEVSIADQVRVWPGECPLGEPSTVVDLRGGTPVVLRAGAWSAEQVDAAWRRA